LAHLAEPNAFVVLTNKPRRPKPGIASQQTLERSTSQPVSQPARSRYTAELALLKASSARKPLPNTQTVALPFCGIAVRVAPVTVAGAAVATGVPLRQAEDGSGYYSHWYSFSIDRE